MNLPGDPMLPPGVSQRDLDGPDPDAEAIEAEREARREDDWDERQLWGDR